MSTETEVDLRRRRLLQVCALTATPASLAETPVGRPEPLARAVETIDLSWHDSARDRTLPLRVRLPAQGAAPRDDLLPVVLFSHGLGGSRTGGAAWGRAWAAQGYAVLHIQHPGSDETVWHASPGTAGTPRERLFRLRAAADRTQARARIEDVRFVIDEIARRAGARPLEWTGRLDPQRIAMTGHSFGARTTMGLAGERMPWIGYWGQRERRLRAFVAFSPASPLMPPGLDAPMPAPLADHYAGVTGPLLAITGGLDGDILGTGATPENRAGVFDRLPAGDKYMAIFAEGDHGVFGGGPLADQRWLQRLAAQPADVTPPDVWEAIQQATARLTLAFLDAYLRGDDAARAWLQSPAPSALYASLTWRFK